MQHILRIFRNNYRTCFAIAFLILVFYFSKLQSYLLFHTFVELFSIVVAFAVFIVTWNSRRMQDNVFLQLVGISYLFIGALDLLHTLTFKGMTMIPVSGFPANQFWIATRTLEALTFVVGLILLKKHKRFNPELVFLGYFFAALLIMLSILVWQIFPVSFIEGVGQTPFKIYAEYAVVVILSISVYLLIKLKRFFSPEIYQLLLISLFFTILSEFCFTLYISNYSTANEIGHYAKLISFILIYKANVETAFIRPTDLIFKNLGESEEKYRTLASELKKTEQQLQGLVDTKDKLFSIIAHDLKNPFTALLTYSELISKNSGTLDRVKIGHMAARMHESARQAYGLLENLLHWSRLQTGLLKPVPEEILVSELFAAAEKLAIPLAQSKGISVHFEKRQGLVVKADKQMVATVLRNLLSNAIKFSYEGSKVEIDAVPQGKQVIFTISDQGTGIAIEHQQKLLEVGNQFSAPGTAAEQGTGLGLVLCREFVESNGGRIWLESRLGFGTSFSFSLPVF
ncbi:sensor histidine kinase [Pedobacter sp. GR22-6]|uniref:sensor histidine kinase n=1 Tax=Pedobacter sp. GR22-6 TaxID=3127957 RepID=UPI00307FAB12